MQADVQNLPELCSCQGLVLKTVEVAIFVGLIQIHNLVHFYLVMLCKHLVQVLCRLFLLLDEILT